MQQEQQVPPAKSCDCAHTLLLHWLSPRLQLRWRWCCNYLTCLYDMDWTFAGCWWEGFFGGLYFWKDIASHPSWHTQIITGTDKRIAKTSLTSSPFVQAQFGLLWLGSKPPLESLTLCCACLLKVYLEHLAWKLGITPNSCWKLLVSITANRNKALLTWAKSDLDLSPPYTEHACKKTVPDSAGRWFPCDAIPM